MNPQRLLDRFLRYVAVDTTADPEAEGYPSSTGQLVLGQQLVSELADLGIVDACQDEHGIITATVPATARPDAPVVALNAHLDTSPETSGRDVQPQVIRGYQGGDIILPKDRSRVIRVDENPELAALVGCTLITTDGTTLLGGDDKAGIAVIMETVAHLMEHRSLGHGPVRILFTCDEEIGHGVDHVDVSALDAAVCYTLDGPGAAEIDVETFSADLATVTVRGVNIHPSIAKGRMVNALRAAGEFVAALPRERLSPETTCDREGFLHPYSMEGGVEEVALQILLRDFDTDQLTVLAERLRELAGATAARFPGCEIRVETLPQYRNLRDGLAREPRAVEYAAEAHRRLNREPALTVIRGGTDGSRLTELGLPTPNLSTGQHNPHSPLEWACLEEMQQAVEVLVELLQVWCEKPTPGDVAAAK